MNKPKISVVIPAHNEEKYIRRCIDALTKQTVKPHEIIVVDNNSTDKTVKIVESYPEVLLLHESKQGIIPARDKGFNATTGDVIARCDADTIVYPDWIEKIQNIFNAKEIDAVSGPADYYDIPKNIDLRTLQIYFFFDLWKSLKRYDTMFGSNMAFTKKIWERIKNDTVKNDKHIHEDMDIAIQITKNGGKTLFDKKLLVSISSRRYTEKPTTMPNYAYRWINGFLYDSSISNSKFDSPLLKLILKNYEPDGHRSFSMKGFATRRVSTHIIKNNITVSVVIPAYNEEKYIEKTLKALKIQTVTADEIIVVDNGSTDNTARIAAAYGCRVISETRRGTAFARNAGFDAAKCEMIARTDADTIVDKHWIERIKKYAAFGAKAFTGPVFLDAPIVKSNVQAINAFMLFLKIMFGKNMWLGANMVMSKEVWIEAKKFINTEDSQAHEDMDLAIAVNKYSEIEYKSDLFVLTSSRRIKSDPKSLFIDYQMRLFKMVAKRYKQNFRKYYTEIRRFMEKEIFSEDW